MIRFINQIFLTASLCYLSQGFLGLPWWTSSVIAFGVAAIVADKSWSAFSGGFIGVFAVWAGWALVKDMATDHILSYQIGQLFPGKPGPTFLGILTGIIGGLPAAFSALSGFFLKSVLKKD